MLRFYKSGDGKMSKVDKSASKGKEGKRIVQNIGVAGAQAEIVQRYGSAVKEQFVAYTGTDRETGQVLKKGLESISKEKISEAQRYQSIKAQAGYAAEVKTVARENADKIIAGDKSRVSRTDDLPKDLTSSSGQPVGGVNNQLYDIITVGEDGSYIEGTARQLKYVGKDASECCDRLLQKKFDKYRDADATIEVPKDFYDGVRAELDKRIENLNDQIHRAEAKGNLELAQRHRAQLQQVKKTKENLKQGKLTSDEAIEARLHPKLSTAKDITRISHRAGLEAAKTGAVIGGGMSFIRNSVAVLKGDETPEDAVLAVAGDTASAAGLSYATGFMGSAIKGGMQNAESIYLRGLSNSALPAMIATSVLEVGKTLYRFADGQIDGLQCLNELGEKGTGIVASTAGATIGQILIPIPIVGGLIGSMCGYALSSMYYNTLTSALNEAKVAHEERLRIEAECEAAITAIRQYRLEMELAIRNYLTDHISAFDSAFSQMQKAFNTGNVDLLVESANSITETLGGEVLFHTTGELDALMAGEDMIII